MGRRDSSDVELTLVELGVRRAGDHFARRIAEEQALLVVLSVEPGRKPSTSAE